MTDDLFRPTIQPQRAMTDRPWRPDSIVYPAFFGGPLAGTVLGVLNARRLQLAARAIWAIVGVGFAALVGRILITGLVGGGGRILGSLCGVAVWGVILFLQKRPFRRYELNDGEPASLVGPGLAAAIGCGLLEAAVIAGVVTVIA